MKIRKIEFEKNPVLGNLKLDFTDSGGKVVDTIILAGENGSGKSYLLNIIYYFSIPTLLTDYEKSEEKRYFEVEFNSSEMSLIKEIPRFSESINQDLKDNIFRFHTDYSIVGNWESTKIRVTKQNGQEVQFNGSLFNGGDGKRALTTIFSDTEINFTPQNIQTVTAMNIDEGNVTSHRSNSNVATNITQLLIDIQSNDALEFSEWAKENIGQQIDQNKLDVRIRRFSKAFENMFPNKRYDRIETIQGNKTVIFKEHGREMEIRHLSSGEKQVVFRGGFLLKNKESAKGALILIDEPEISMHPKWQLKVLSFFKQLFSNGIEQTSQMIVATHSPFVIHNSNRSNDKVIILQKNAEGQITIQDDPTFYSWSNQKKVETAFEVGGIVKPNKTTVFLEGETDEMYFQKTAEIFGINDNQITFKWIGRINENGQAEFTGDSALNQARTFFLANEEMINGKVVLLYDNDTNKQEETKGDFAVRRMSDELKNNFYKIGVESLLDLKDDFDKDPFYKEITKKDDYGAESTYGSLDKKALADYICGEMSVNNQKLVLAGIKKEIEKLT